MLSSQPSQQVAVRLSVIRIPHPAAPMAYRFLPVATTVLQLAMPHYRQQFLDCVQEQTTEDDQLTFLVGDEQFGIGVTTAVDSPLIRRSGRNRYFAGRRLAWQPHVIRPAILADTAIVELNPRLL